MAYDSTEYTDTPSLDPQTQRGQPPNLVRPNQRIDYGQGQVYQRQDFGGGSGNQAVTEYAQPGGDQRQPGANQGGGGAGGVPSYVNMNDPVHQAVMSAFQKKGIQPRDQTDFQYWVDHINQSGGLEGGYARTGGTGTWASRMASGSGGVGDYGGSGGGGGGGGGDVTRAYGPGGSTSYGLANPALAGNLFNQLLSRSQQSLAVNPSDPIIKGQTDAFAAQQDRSGKNYLSGLAEKAGSNANIGAEGRSVAEQAGQSTGQFQGALMQNELTARRGEISQALQGMQGMLTDDQRNALALEMKQIDDATARLGIQSGNQQFAANYGLNAMNQANFWDARRMGY